MLDVEREIMSVHGSSRRGPWRCPSCEVSHDGAGDLPIQGMYIDVLLPERKCEDCKKEEKEKTNQRKVGKRDHEYVRRETIKQRNAGLTLNEIAVIMNMRGYVTTRGTIYTAQSIANILNRKNGRSKR